MRTVEDVDVLLAVLFVGTVAVLVNLQATYSVADTVFRGSVSLLQQVSVFAKGLV